MFNSKPYNDPNIKEHQLNDSVINTVGNFFMVGFEGTEVTEEVTLLITKYRISSIILSGRNFINASQAKTLISSLQQLARESNYEYPINFVIDEEGGMLNALFDKNYITQFPGAMALSATGSYELIYQIYRAIAKELKSIGFSMCLGPVLDILKNTSNTLMQQIIGVRSAGYDLESVILFAKAATRAFKDERLINCGKHFPGYGSATVNSNFELPMIFESSEQLFDYNLVPYKQLINENLLDSILVGGCAVPGVNNHDLHACLSPTIVTNILREKLAFRGIVISECLLLEALDRNFGVVQGCISAFSVGCDLIMLCSNFEIQQQAIMALASVIEDQIIDFNILNNSIGRIKNLRKSLLSWQEFFNLSFLSQDILNQHKLLSKKAYSTSLTVIRDSGLPITKYLTPNVENENTILLLTPLISPLYEIVDIHGNKSHINNIRSEDTSNLQLNYGEDVFIELGRMISNYKSGYKVLHTSYNSNGLTSFHEELILRSKVILFFCAETTNNLYQVGVSKHVSMLCNSNSNKLKRNNTANTNSAHSTNRHLIIVSVSSPTDFLYDINLGGSPTGYLCTYDYTINALSNLPKLLFGDFNATGIIPGLKTYLKTNKNSIANLNRQTTHSWLVEVFDYKRDWENLVNFLKNNNQLDFSLKDSFLISLKRLFIDIENHKSFVVRNTSSKSILGISVTWVYNSFNLDQTLAIPVGNFMFLLVDKNKRNISIGSYLYSKTMKYLCEESKCSKIYLCGDFPKLTIKNDFLFNISDENMLTLRFFKRLGWNFNGNNNSATFIRPNKKMKLNPKDKLTIIPTQQHIKYLMVLDDILNWKVAENLVRQLQVVGIMFDICKDPTNIFTLYKNKAVFNTTDGNSKEYDGLNQIASYEIYLELFKEYGLLNNNNDSNNKETNSLTNLDIITALEPTKKSVVGSLIVLNENSKFLKFYPFLSTINSSTKKFVCITGHFIDPLYTTLSEVFKLGLICTALMYVKNKYPEYSNCYIMDIDEKQVRSLQDDGFKVVEKYYNYYSVIFDK